MYKLLKNIQLQLVLNEKYSLGFGTSLHCAIFRNAFIGREYCVWTDMVLSQQDLNFGFRTNQSVWICFCRLVNKSQALANQHQMLCVNFLSGDGIVETVLFAFSFL